MGVVYSNWCGEPKWSYNCINDKCHKLFEGVADFVECECGKKLRLDLAKYCAQDNGVDFR